MPVGHRARHEGQSRGRRTLPAYQAGRLQRVGFGVESGDPTILRNVIKKSQSLDQVRNAFRWAKDAGLQTMGFFIFGMPQETEETMEKTIKFALELDPTWRTSCWRRRIRAPRCTT